MVFRFKLKSMVFRFKLKSMHFMWNAQISLKSNFFQQIEVQVKVFRLKRKTKLSEQLQCYHDSYENVHNTVSRNWPNPDHVNVFIAVEDVCTTNYDHDRQYWQRVKFCGSHTKRVDTVLDLLLSRSEYTINKTSTSQMWEWKDIFTVFSCPKHYFNVWYFTSYSLSIKIDL